MERPVFLRERLNHTYTTSSYFWGRTSSGFPIDLLFPLINVSIVYFVIGLADDVGKFFLLGETKIINELN